MKTRYLLVILLLALAAAAMLAAPQAAPRLEVVGAPVHLNTGDTLKFTVRADDPAGVIAILGITVRELQGVMEQLPPVGKSQWGFEFTFSPEFQQGVYTLDLVARDKDGFLVPLAPGSATRVRFTIGTESKPQAPPAPPFRVPLVERKVTGTGGKAILIRHPYRSLAGGWYKGMLHTHTTNSDGRTPPPVLVGKYLAHGFDWLMIADHQVVTRDERSDTGQPIVRLLGAERATSNGDMICINFTDPQPSRLGQDTINLVTAKGGLVMFPHPAVPVGYDVGELQRLQGEAMIEVSNGGREQIQPWEYLLTTGRMVWAAASDDFHGGPDGEPAYSFVCVTAPACTPAAIVQNLRLGNFYASQGPTLSLSWRGNALRVQADSSGGFSFRGPGGVPWASMRSNATNAAVYEFTGEEQGYVRAEFVRSSDGKKAWTQPFWVSEVKSRR